MNVEALKVKTMDMTRADQISVQSNEAIRAKFQRFVAETRERGRRFFVSTVQNYHILNALILWLDRLSIEERHRIIDEALTILEEESLPKKQTGSNTTQSKHLGKGKTRRSKGDEVS